MVSRESRTVLAKSLRLNSTCADCSTKNPKWISTTFGVVVCTECSGAHKSLKGGELSIIKSVEDNLSATDIAILSQLGNEKANSKLEEKIEDKRKPNPKSPYGEKEEWIRLKYQEKAFTTEGFTSLEGTAHSRFRKDRQPTYSSGSSIKKGFLNKRGGSYKSWKRRYFILSGTHLSYYRSPGDSAPLGVIQLVLSTIKALPTEEKENMFAVITPARTYYLQADTGPEVSTWVESLQSATSAIKRSDTLTKETKKVHHEGILLKEGNNLVKDWKKRYFILDGDKLNYYRKKGMKEPLGTITITSCTPKVAETKSKKHCIEIATPGRSYWVAAENPEEMHTWIRCIQEGSQQVLDDMISSPRRSKTDFPPPAFMQTPSVPYRLTEKLKTNSSLLAPSKSANFEVNLSQSVGQFATMRPSRAPYKINSVRKDVSKEDKQKFEEEEEEELDTVVLIEELKQGWLTKMGNNVIKDWKKRWVLLKSDQIEYFKNRLDSTPAGSISLVAVNVKISSLKPHCMEVVTPNRSYWFLAEDDEERDEWISAISTTTLRLMSKILSGKKEIPKIKEAKGELPSGVQFQGWIQKQGKKGLKPYRQRWAVIREDMLLYYNTEHDTEPLGRINLLFCTVKTTIQGGAFFDIITPQRIYHFQANSKQEMMSWLNYIRNASEKVYSQLEEVTPYDESTFDTRCSTSTLTSQKSHENTEIIKQLQQLSNYCADCNEPEPGWVSINLGIFICIECSGIHRSLGVHISKVRSIELDRWEDETVEFMQTMSNEKSNAIFEMKLEFDEKPKPNSPREMKEKYIREKYEMLKYSDRANLVKLQPPKPNVKSLNKEGLLFESNGTSLFGKSNITSKKRWCALKVGKESANILLYRSRGDTTPIGVIDILTAAIRPSTQNSFEIITPARIFKFHCGSELEKRDWMEKLKEAIEYCDEQPPQ